MIGAIIAKKAIAASFDAMNRHNLSKFMSAWREDAVFVYPGDIHASGTFRGKDAIESRFDAFFKQFPKIQFDIQEICVRNIFALGGTNVVAVYWNVYLTSREGRESQNSGVSLVTIKGGKVVLVKDFIFDLGENFRVGWVTA
jgi:uncharacterized protein (TIGR02246 family)